MQLALTLTKSMIQLHATGWLHKGYESRSVIFFLDNMTDRTKETGECQDSETSSALQQCRAPRKQRQLLDQPTRSLYPPHLSRLAPLQHRPRDLPHQSFQSRVRCVLARLLLLEIGLWRRLTELWKPAYQSKEPTYWTKRLCQRYIPELGGRCGEMYQCVVRDPLSLGDPQGWGSPAPLTNFELLQLLEGIHT
jgi:hypothetical protein